MGCRITAPSFGGDTARFSAARRRLLTPACLCSALPSVTQLLRERSLRHGVEARRVLGQILLPALGVPQFQMVANADKDHLTLKPGELGQAIGNQNPSTAVHVDRFGLSEVQPAKDPRLGISCRRLIELGRQLLQLRLGEKPQALIRPRRHKQGIGFAKLLSQLPRHSQAFLVVKGALVGPGKQHRRFRTPAHFHPQSTTTILIRPPESRLNKAAIYSIVGVILGNGSGYDDLVNCNGQLDCEFGRSEGIFCRTSPDLWRSTFADERKLEDFWGFVGVNEAGLSAIIRGIMAEYFLETPENMGNFNVFAAGGAQTYIRNYGVVLFPLPIGLL